MFERSMWLMNNNSMRKGNSRSITRLAVAELDFPSIDFPALATTDARHPARRRMNSGLTPSFPGSGRGHTCPRFRMVWPGPDFAYVAIIRFFLLPVHMQLVMNRGVGNRVETGIRRTALVDMPVPFPARDDEDVVPLPGEGLAVDLGRAAALDDAVDGAAGMAMGARRLVRPEQLRLERKGRHDRTAVHRIRVLDDDAVIGASGLVAKPVKHFPRLVPAVEVFRRMHAAAPKFGAEPGNDAAGSEQALGIARRPDVALAFPANRLARVRPGVAFVIIPFGHGGVQPFDQRHIEHVHPHDGAGSVVAVIVPFAVRRDHEIAAFERAFLAADGGVAARALEQEAARVCHVAVHPGAALW